MVAAALSEEQLQNSLAMSEEDAEFEEDDELAADLMADNADAYAANIQLQNGMANAIVDGEEEEDEVMADEQAILSDEDAEGEEDDEIGEPAFNNGEAEDEDEEEEESDEDDDEEGVGAVKIQPGLLEDDEDVASPSEDEESAASVEDDDESKDSTDAEVEEQWQQAAEEEEEEEEPANPNRCMYVSPHSCRAALLTNFRFCQQDEENDPSEEFELYLACGVCGDNCWFSGLTCIFTRLTRLLQHIGNALGAPTRLSLMMVNVPLRSMP